MVVDYFALAQGGGLFRISRDRIITAPKEMSSIALSTSSEEILKI